MIQHSLDEMRCGNFDVLKKITHNILAKHYHFLEGRLWYGWKSKDVKAATVTLFNYEIL